jgi:hypothetical protein
MPTMKYTLRSCLTLACILLAIPSQANAAAAISQTVVTYTDPTGNLIPFAFGVDTNKVQQIRFPSTVTGPQQTEVLNNPLYSNYGYTGVYPTVSIGTILPSGSVASSLFTGFVSESTNFTVTTAQSGIDFVVTTGSNQLTATLPAATVDFYFFITKADSGGSVSLSTSAYPINTSLAQQGATALVWSDGTNWYMRTWTDYWDSSGDYYISAGGNPSGAAGALFFQVNATSNAYINFNNLSAVDPLLRSTAGGGDFAFNIQGTNGTLSAPTGSIGEYVSATAGTGSVSLTSGSQVNVTSISLTAGDWDVGGGILVTPAGTTTTSLENGGINTTSATMPAQNDGSSSYSIVAIPAGSGGGFTINPGGKRLLITATTTVYLVAQCTFAVSTETAGGTLWGRRRR